MGVNDDTPTATTTGTVQLEKSFGFFRSFSFIIGSIIGSGIFVSPQGITYAVGSSGASLVIWVVCGVISALSALCYAELGTLIPESGAEYTYIKHGYGRPFAFLQGWLSMTITGPSGIAIMCTTCAIYLLAPFYQDTCGEPPGHLVKLTACLIIVAVVAVNCYSTSGGADLNVIFTAAKVLAMALIIIGGFIRLVQGHTEHLAKGFVGTEASPGSIALSIYIGMWAYTGWSALNFVTEEVKDPARNMPLSIGLGLTSVTIIYLLINVSYFTVLSPEELVMSPAVAVSWTQGVAPDLVWLMSLFIAISTGGAAMATLYSASRVYFVVARDNNIPESLSYVHVEYKTPFISIAVTGALSICYVIPSNINALMNIFGFTMWLSMTVVFIAVFILRYKQPYKTMERPFRVPSAVVVLAILIGLYALVAPLVDGAQIEMLYAILFILAGFILYVPFVHFGLVIPGTDHVTTFLQLAIRAVPPPQFDLQRAYKNITRGNERAGDTTNDAEITSL